MLTEQIKTLNFSALRSASFDANRNAAWKSNSGNSSYCQLCGKPVNVSRAMEVEIVHGGGEIVIEGVADWRDAGYCGVHFVGSECAAKLRKEIAKRLDELS